MPTYRRVETLRRVLRAYEEQAPPSLDFELVVVDDGSDDDTTEVLASWRPERYRLRFARQQNQGPAAARNHALTMASGTWVLFTGDDIEPTPDLLLEHHRAHQALADPQVAVLGLIRWAPDAETTTTMRHIDGVGAQQFSYHYLEAGQEVDFRHLYTSNVSLRRDFLLTEEGPFSTDFPAAAFEDAELGFRLAERGMRIVYHPAAVAYHHHPYSASAFYRRQQRCGAMAAVLYGLHPELRRYLDLEVIEDLNTDLALGRRPPIATPASQEIARALGVAEHYDPMPFPQVDPLLQPLFRIGYLDGLTHALYPNNAGRILDALVADLLTPVVDHLAIEAHDRGLPWPAGSPAPTAP